MKNRFRKFLWKLLGKNYYEFLLNQNLNYLNQNTSFQIGKNTYNNGARVWKWNDNATLTIGNFCSIANDVNFILDSGNHQLFNITAYPLLHQLYKYEETFIYEKNSYTQSSFNKLYKPIKHSITVGNDVWIGSNVTILPGVKIGNGVTIYAGTIVSKDIADFSIVAGVPAKFLGYKFPIEYHNQLNKISWWNWSEEKIKQHIEDFSLSTEDFVAKHYK